MMERSDCDVDEVESWRSKFSNEALAMTRTYQRLSSAG